MLYYENFDTSSMVTPIKGEIFCQMLREAKYDQNEINFLHEGFTKGFSIEYHGNMKAQILSNNLRFDEVGTETMLWNKVMKEVKAKRFAGPFRELPFSEHYIQSPIGLVPKDDGKETRLIFHLSHPKGKGTSVNAGTPEDLCKVKYPAFDKAIQICLREGKNCKIGRSDAKSAFRNLGIRPEDWWLLIMKAKSPIDGKFYYFFDKALPFGASISCSHFQRVSNAISHLVQYRIGKSNVNYLDDFLFAAMVRMLCNNQIRAFIEICETIGMPVNLDKTYWATSILVFLGLLINTETQTVSIPTNKIYKAFELIDRVLNNKSKKVTLHQLQQICGFLNFLGRCIVPGRAFTRRLYAHGAGAGLKPHHHIRINSEMRLDLEIWREFLKHPSVFCRPFLDYSSDLKANEIDFYTDASGKIGYGGISETQFMWGVWDQEFLRECKPDIAYLELFALTAAILAWIHKYRNKRVTVFVDNTNVRDEINSNSSSCKNRMILIRIIVLKCLVENVRVSAKYVKSKDNVFADSLSRGKLGEFRRLSKGKHDKEPTPIPEIIWPMSKVWEK